MQTANFILPLNAFILPLKSRRISKLYKILNSGYHAFDIRKHPVTVPSICFLYAVKPAGKVVAYYQPAEIFKIPVNEIWLKYQNNICFKSPVELKIFAGRSTYLYIIRIQELKYLKNKYNLNEFIEKFTENGQKLRRPHQVPYSCNLRPSALSVSITIKEDDII